MTLLTKISRIRWKYVVGTNLTLLILSGLFATMQPAINHTDNRSQAADPVAAPLTSIYINPQNPPQLLHPDPDWGKVGDAVVVTAKNLGKIPFGTLRMGQIKVPHENIIDWQPDQIVFTIPSDAVTAPIYILMNQTKFSTKSSLTIRSTNP